MKFKRKWIAIMTVLLLFSTSGFVQAAVNTSSVDTTKPVIKGVKDVKSVQGMPINLLKGVSAKDETDGKLTSKISVSKVDFSKVGDQTITYTVKDKAGNKATATAKLTIVGVSEDEVIPAIDGYKDLVTDKGKKINLLEGITAIDNVDCDLSDKIKVSKVDFNKVGVQKVTYSVVDSAGNKGQISVNIKILDKKLTKCNIKKYVVIRKATIYSNAHSWSESLKDLSYRDGLTVTATIKDSKWVRVKLSDGTVGYCFDDFLSTKQPVKKNIQDVPGRIVKEENDMPYPPEYDCEYSIEQLKMAGKLWAEEKGLTVKGFEDHPWSGGGFFLKASDGYYYCAKNSIRIAGQIVTWDKAGKWTSSDNGSTSNSSGNTNDDGIEVRDPSVTGDYEDGHGGGL